MKKTLILAALLISFTFFSQAETRTLQKVTFSGSGYELGLQHGTTLKSEISDIIKEWKENTSKQLGKDADEVLDEFFEYAQFTETIKKITPELYEEVKGIAVGSGQELNDVLVLNLLDEFWVYVNNINNHHCSSIGVPAQNGNPGFISQNMDLENYTDGFQVLMRLERTDSRPQQLILTHPGLIALNGLNEEGIGVCVNTLMQLKASSSGLPVAFVIRHILNSTDKESLLEFIQNVSHASGQNYIIGIKGEVFDFEASANKVVRFDPKNDNGTVYHTNHPIVNDDIKPWFEKYDPNLPDHSKPTTSNSFQRFNAVEKRMTVNSIINDQSIIAALQSKDNKDHPVCRTNLENGRGYTFASIVISMAKEPYIQITAGPPDESEFKRFDFSPVQ